jgi:hypothetical protein
LEWLVEWKDVVRWVRVYWDWRNFTVEDVEFRSWWDDEGQQRLGPVFEGFCCLTLCARIGDFVQNLRSRLVLLR